MIFTGPKRGKYWYWHAMSSTGEGDQKSSVLYNAARKGQWTNGQNG